MFLLKGFVSDVSGSEYQMFEAAPILVDDHAPDQLLVSPGLNWRFDALRPLQRQQYRDVSLLSAGRQLPVEEGFSVWVVGKALAESLRVHGAPKRSLEIGAWITGARGVKVYSGHRTRFTELAQSLKSDFELKLHDALIDPLSKEHGYHHEFFRAYCGVPSADTRKELVNRLLFYREAVDATGYEMALAEALIYEVFESEAEATQSVQQLRDFIFQERLSDKFRPQYVERDASSGLSAGANLSLEDVRQIFRSRRVDLKSDREGMRKH